MESMGIICEKFACKEFLKASSATHFIVKTQISQSHSINVLYADDKCLSDGSVTQLLNSTSRKLIPNDSDGFAFKRIYLNGETVEVDGNDRGLRMFKDFHPVTTIENKYTEETKWTLLC